MARYCIGIDLGGTFIKFGLLDEQMRPCPTFQLPTPLDKGGPGVVAQMVAGARQAMEQKKLKPEDIVGVGIGSPGPINIANGIVISLPNIAAMENMPLRDEVSRGLGLPAVLENDANAAGYGEYICGVGKGGGDLVMLTLGTGVGSGIIIHGKVLHGQHELGAEMGHMIVDPGGEACNCGQRGCLERYCSAFFMTQYAVRLLGQGRKSSLKAIMDKAGAIDAKDICQARNAGDELATEVWDRAMYYLAIGCVSICRIFDPDRIVLAGGLIKAGDDLLAPLHEHFNRLHWKLTKPKTRIMFSSLGTDAGVFGAAGIAWSALGGQ